MFGSATMPFVLNNKSVPKSNHQRLMEIRRPNLNLQDTYVMMNGQIIERSKYRAPNPSRAEQYAALLEAHKTSRYMRNENPLEDPYAVRRLDQTAKINHYLQGAEIARTKAEIAKNLFDISKQHQDLSAAASEGLMDKVEEIRQEIVNLAQRNRALINTIAAPRSTGTVYHSMRDFESVFSEEDAAERGAENQALNELMYEIGLQIDREQQGVDDMGVQTEPVNQFDSGNQTDQQMADLGVQTEPVTQFDSGNQTDQVQQQMENLGVQTEPVQQQMADLGVQTEPVNQLDSGVQTDQAQQQIEDVGVPSDPVDTTPAELLPVLQENVQDNQTIIDLEEMLIAQRLEMFRMQAEAERGEVTIRESSEAIAPATVEEDDEDDEEMTPVGNRDPDVIKYEEHQKYLQVRRDLDQLRRDLKQQKDKAPMRVDDVESYIVAAEKADNAVADFETKLKIFTDNTPDTPKNREILFKKQATLADLKAKQVDANIKYSDIQRQALGLFKTVDTQTEIANQIKLLEAEKKRLKNKGADQPVPAIKPNRVTVQQQELQTVTSGSATRSKSKKERV